jgi:hypothetical protein
MTVLRSVPARLACLQPGSEQRQARRRAVNFAATLEDAGASAQDVQVLDLSATGFRLSAALDAEPGSSLLIKLPFIEATRARVIWARGGEVGCAFSEPLRPADLDAALGRAGSLGPRPTVRRGQFGLRGVL